MSYLKPRSTAGTRSRKDKVVIFGAHIILYSKDAAADRAFLRDVLGLASVDAGHGWLIFALPPAEVAIHPEEVNSRHELYLMCDDLKAEMSTLVEKGVRCSGVQEARWGSITKIQLPGGGEIGLYQPRHPTALVLASH
jgi:catechol 2,3-dioxygenase-like lactoylglutathione lyase family enzyme